MTLAHPYLLQHCLGFVLQWKTFNKAVDILPLKKKKVERKAVSNCALHNMDENEGKGNEQDCQVKLDKKK